MLTCKESAELISKGLDDSIPFYKKFLIRLHLRACITCDFYCKQVTALQKIFHCYPDPAEEDEPGDPCLSDEAKTRLKEVLDHS